MPSILTWRRASYRREKLSQSRSKFEKLKALYYISFETFVMLCAILYHVCSSKNVKNNHGSNTFSKVAGSKVCMFLKLGKWYKIGQSVTYVNFNERHSHSLGLSENPFTLTLHNILAKYFTLYSSFSTKIKTHENRYFLVICHEECFET